MIMELKNNLYTITGKSILDGNAIFEIQLNHDNLIYAAHFPDKPITPGVCIIQIAKELMEEILNRELYISNIKNVKFLSIIVPIIGESYRYILTKIKEDEDYCSAQVNVVASDGTPCAKISFSCISN